MKQFFKGPLDDHSRNIMRRLGYGEQRTRQGQISYVKRVSGGAFPRYHVYVEDTENGMQVNLHVDQKAASYEGSSAHGGEYDGPLVEQEMQRIAQGVTSANSAPAAPVQPKTTESKKGFWGKLIG
jgi:hypothetical protein